MTGSSLGVAGVAGGVEKDPADDGVAIPKIEFSSPRRGRSGTYWAIREGDSLTSAHGNVPTATKVAARSARRSPTAR